MNLTKNFTLAECCKTSKAIPNTANATITAHKKETCEQMAQPIRDLYGRGIIITSGYRSPAVNRAAGGAANFSHLYGYALDTKPADADMAAYTRCLLQWAGTHPFDQIIFEKVNPRTNLPQWVHIGWRRGDGTQRRQVLRQVQQGKHWVYQPYKAYK